MLSLTNSYHNMPHTTLSQILYRNECVLSRSLIRLSWIDFLSSKIDFFGIGFGPELTPRISTICQLLLLYPSVISTFTHTFNTKVIHRNVFSPFFHASQKGYFPIFGVDLMMIMMVP